MAPRERITIFLRMAAVQLQRLAEREPRIAIELRHVAAGLEEEASDLQGDEKPGESPGGSRA
jgi:hypothetical protein